MQYFLKIFGCQMNQSDSERIAAILEKYKLKPAASIDAADLVVFVTCGVRQSAEDRVNGQINNIKKKYPEKKIILTGCLAHRKDVQRRLKDKVGLFFGINEIEKLEENIKSETFSVRKKFQTHKNIRIKNTRYEVPDIKISQCIDYFASEPKHTSLHTAYIPIMTGCDNFCAYCVVPYARGREYSRPAEYILKEVKSLVKKGYKEIILLGQNVNSYQSKINSRHSEIHKLFQNSKFEIQNSGEINFSKLLKIIDAFSGHFWITFLTSHPKDMSDDLIKTIAKSKKICEYVSLPAQSGDNEILRKMNRNYTIEHYKDLVNKIHNSFLSLSLGNSQGLDLGKSSLPPAISTDIIVGFPGETKKQFKNTAKLMREMKFDMAYIAQYSPRPETAAWKLKDNVSKYEKVQREKILTDILSRTSLENNKKYLGKEVEVLVDKRFDLEEFRAIARKGKVEPWKGKKYLAHTRTQKKVIFISNKKIPVGSFQKVKITKAKAFGLEGEKK